jgi:carotenoid cleavage dioxygenase-like enzyme
MTTEFPDSPDFTGYNEPMRMECDIFDLIVEGEIPQEIEGNWYRMTPDPQYPPPGGNDVFISGDGMISGLFFKDGHCDFKQRYVMTERLLDDRAARRALHGRYRNPYTDDPSVRGHRRGAANTTPVFHGGKLMALKEDSRPMLVDPLTLATLGEWDFDGKLKSETMTAHPRWDPETDELCFFGYEASGLASKDVAVCRANPDGRLVSEDWFEGPYCALMHDYAVTKDYIVLPFMPITSDRARIEAGGPHWIWEPERESYIGIMPRDGSVGDLRWFKRPPGFVFHYINAFSEGSKVYVDACYTEVNPFPFITIESGLAYDPADMKPSLRRWTFDLSKPGESFDEDVIGPGGDMPRVADKDLMQPYDVVYYATVDPSLGPPKLQGPVGAGFNSLIRLETGSGRLTSWDLGNDWTVNEPIHIASKQSGHDGYLALIIDDHTKYLSEIALLEAGDITKGPIARIKLPIRLRPQVHGNWIDAERF